MGHGLPKTDKNSKKKRLDINAAYRVCCLQHSLPKSYAKYWNSSAYNMCSVLVYGKSAMKYVYIYASTTARLSNVVDLFNASSNNQLYKPNISTHKHAMTICLFHSSFFTNLSLIYYCLLLIVLFVSSSCVKQIYMGMCIRKKSTSLTKH